MMILHCSCLEIQLIVVYCGWIVQPTELMYDCGLCVCVCVCVCARARARVRARLRFFCLCKIMCSVKRPTFPSLFPTWMPFTSLSCLITLGRPWVQCWVDVVNVDILSCPWPSKEIPGFQWDMWWQLWLFGRSFDPDRRALLKSHWEPIVFIKYLFVHFVNLCPCIQQAQYWPPTMH